LSEHTPPITQFLRDWREGDADSAGRVVSELYSELHRMAAHLLRSERAGHTLQPTALINEVYLRLGSEHAPEWRNRAHFFAVVATTLRRILIDHARAHRSDRRGGGEVNLSLDEVKAGSPCSYDDLLIIDEALSQLELADPRAARVTELRFFAGLQENEIAEELSVSEITVKRDWKFARAWLAAHLQSRTTFGHK
jgi:RNA polymerase sigma factor (TIGR02999 family)